MRTIEINGTEFECTRPKIDLSNGNESIILGIIGDYRPESKKMQIVYEHNLYNCHWQFQVYIEDKDITKYLIWIER